MTRSRATKYQLRAGLATVVLGAVVFLVTVLAGVLRPLEAVLVVGMPTAIHMLVLAWLVRRWCLPLSDLARRMDEVRKEESIRAVAVTRDDEIGDLVRHFNALLEGIQSARLQSVEIARKQANIEKFAALGRLSAGVAHEINNPVGGILTCLETMRGLEPGSARYEEYLDLVRSGLERIGTIVRQLLSFARQPKGERSDLDLNDIIREVTVLSAFHNRKQEIDIHHEQGDIPAVTGVPDLLNQLFLNFVLNALQAMPDGGTLRIRTWADDGTVSASFEDTGPGIPEENLERIFEPFFTTKEVGVGTGLGLSVALGIVEAHGGSIQVENRSGGGARFTVALPAAHHGGSDASSGETDG